MMNILDKITLSKVVTFDLNLLLDTLQNEGIAIIPDYLESNDLNHLNQEFESIFTLDHDFIKPFDYSEGRGANVLLEKVDEAILPHTKKIFSQNWMQELANSYLQGATDLNKDVYVVNDVVGSKHVANDLHFDVLQTFKYFIYLTDTTAENGAFTCAPGTQKRAQQLREKYGADISYENRHLTRDLPVKPEEVIPIEGKAGTLIIFDTDVFHKAGQVQKGERRVMRGHTRLKNLTQTSYFHSRPSLIQRVKNKLRKVLS